ncbi:hypothetical protein Ddye_021402 [Dipteronia dyeriana]|uniref:Uncharacterized protein n=1 Tax=Dipteronia dyeriana TaxID=168575 RepID=A0AAD9U1M9_9ROSI|nr:hypothetical protein Ddye_021402 [Dipteronia dyeriana]
MDVGEDDFVGKEDIDEDKVVGEDEIVGKEDVVVSKGGKEDVVVGKVGKEDEAGVKGVNGAGSIAIEGDRMDEISSLIVNLDSSLIEGSGNHCEDASRQKDYSGDKIPPEMITGFEEQCIPVDGNHLHGLSNHFTAMMAALDFIACVTADVFAMTNSGSQLSSLVSGFRTYYGGRHAPNLCPNKKRLAAIL